MAIIYKMQSIDYVRSGGGGQWLHHSKSRRGGRGQKSPMMHHVINERPLRAGAYFTGSK